MRTKPSCRFERDRGEFQMFIVHVVRQFHPGVGGLENVVHELASAQVSAGHRVRVVTLDRLFNGANRQRLPATETLDGIEIVRIPYFGSSRYPDRPVRAPAHQGRGSGSCPRHRFLLRLSRLDQADPWPHARRFHPWRLFSHQLRRQTEALLVCHGHATVDEILRGHRRRQRVRLRTVQPGPSRAGWFASKMAQTLRSSTMRLPARSRNRSCRSAALPRTRGSTF